MKLSQEFKLASELREKVHLAEDQLRTEKKNLFRAQALLAGEKEKWAEEAKEQDERIAMNEVLIREKETRYDEVKMICNEVMHRSVLIEAENEALKKELQKAKLQKDDDMCKYLLEQGNLELELAKIQEWKKDVKVSQRWKKVMQLTSQGEGLSSDLLQRLSLQSEGSAVPTPLPSLDRPLSKISSEQKMMKMLNSFADIKSDSQEVENKNKNKEVEEAAAFMDKLQ